MRENKQQKIGLNMLNSGLWLPLYHMEFDNTQIFIWNALVMSRNLQFISKIMKLKNTSFIVGFIPHNLFQNKIILWIIIFMSDCSRMYPPTPCLGVGAHVENVCTYPQPPPEQKILRTYFTQNFFNKIRSLKCLFYSIILK